MLYSISIVQNMNGGDYRYRYNLQDGLTTYKKKGLVRAQAIAAFIKLSVKTKVLHRYWRTSEAWTIAINQVPQGLFDMPESHYTIISLSLQL